MKGGITAVDLTFKSYGSISTYEVVRIGRGSPTGYRDYCETCPGTLDKGTVIPLGIAQNGASETGKAITVRCLGPSRAILHSTQGSIIEGHYVRVRTQSSKGKVMGCSSITAGTTEPNAMVGICVGAEGGGSQDAYIDVLVNPEFV